MLFFNYFFVLIEIFLSIAFLTLYERVVLGIGNFRLAPNYFFFLGLFQPIFDVIKLFLKNFFMYYFVGGFYYFIFPLWGFMVFMFYWIFFNFNNMNFFFFYGVFLYFVLYSFIVYKFIFSGWVGFSFYGLLSSYRVIVQMISYEVGLFFVIFLIFFFFFSMDMYVFFYWDFILWFFFSPLFLFFFFFVLIVELSRTPFDFIEGESELVSGFNIEYGGFFFSFIFLVEYGMLILSSLILSYFFLSIYYFFFFVYFFIFVRVLFVRYRYDFLILMFWKDFIFLLFCWIIFILIYF